MSNAVKKTISLPADLARHAEELARAEGQDPERSHSGRAAASRDRAAPAGTAWHASLLEPQGPGQKHTH